MPCHLQLSVRLVEEEYELDEQTGKLAFLLTAEHQSTSLAFDPFNRIDFASEPERYVSFHFLEAPVAGTRPS